MPLKSSKDVGFLLIGGRNVLGAPLTSIGEARERLLEQIDGIGDSTDAWGAVGQRIFEMTQEGFYNSGIGSSHEALEAADPQPLLYALAGNVVGDEFVGISAARTIYDKLPAKGAFHKAKATYKSADFYADVGKGKVTTPYAVYTTVGPTDQAIIDNLAASAAGAILWLGLSALVLDGGTNLAVELRHSTDNFAGDNTQLGAFTVVTTAPFSQRLVVAGTVKRYIRARHTFAGGAGALRSATFATGVERL